jgi:hypothetical protein
MAATKCAMTNRERVDALLRRKKPDRVPVCPFAHGGFSAVNAGYRIADIYILTCRKH